MKRKTCSFRSRWQVIKKVRKVITSRFAEYGSMIELEYAEVIRSEILEMRIETGSGTVF